MPESLQVIVDIKDLIPSPVDDAHSFETYLEDFEGSVLREIQRLDDLISNYKFLISTLAVSKSNEFWERELSKGSSVRSAQDKQRLLKFIQDKGLVSNSVLRKVESNRDFIAGIENIRKSKELLLRSLHIIKSSGNLDVE